MGAKFTCQFTMPTDPDGASYGEEAAAKLAYIVVKLKVDGQSGGILRDDNGNKIGSWKLR